MNKNFQFSIFNFQSISNFLLAQASKFPACAGKQISNSRPKGGAGFTIIELLIAMAVIVVFMGLSLAAYAKFNQRQILLVSGQNLKKILRDVQSRAYTSEIDCDICDCSANTIATLEGWYVDFSTSEIYGYCNNKAFSRTSF